MINSIVERVVKSALSNLSTYNENATLINDLGLDSLTLYCIIWELESEGLVLKTNRIKTITTVRDLIDSLEEKK